MGSVRVGTAQKTSAPHVGPRPARPLAGLGRTRRPVRNAFDLPHASGVRAVSGDGEKLAASRLGQTSGRPLEPGVRGLMEQRFGHSFRNVRVHAGSEADAAARALDARAFTIGSHIGFAANRYAPTTHAGRTLLAHELAHVVQGSTRSSGNGQPWVSSPGDPAEREAGRAAESVAAGLPVRLAAGTTGAAIYRQAAGTATTPAPVDGDTRIRQWLDQHQFAPPAQQPDEGERHVLLNGQDVPLSQAVRLAVAALNLPEDAVRRVIAAGLSPAQLPGLTTAGPFVGPGNTVGGVSLPGLGRRDAFGIDPSFARLVELGDIDRWLDEHHFYQPAVPDPQGDYAMFDGVRTPVDTIADRAYAIIGGNVGPGALFNPAYLTRREVLNHIRQKFVDAPTGPGVQMTLGYTLVPQALQTVAPRPDAVNPITTQHQFSFTITSVRHPSNAGGWEGSVQGSVTIDSSGNIVNLQAGVQAAWVQPLLQGWIQASGLVQLMATENWSRTASGTATVMGAQLAAGGQVLLNPQVRPVRLFNMRAAIGLPQIGIQALVQGSSVGPQVGANIGIVINFPINL